MHANGAPKPGALNSPPTSKAQGMLNVGSAAGCAFKASQAETAVGVA